jgi:hypothetical protein
MTRKHINFTTDFGQNPWKIKIVSSSTENKTTSIGRPVTARVIPSLLD